MTSLKNIISKTENLRKPFIYFILTFFFAATLRNILEALLIYPRFLSASSKMVFLTHLHYYAAYTALALAIILLFYFITRERIDKVAKIVLPCFLILISVPIIDSLAFFLTGKEFYIAYISTNQFSDLFSRFIFFFGPFSKLGITLGMRIEIALVLLGSFFYFKIKTKSIARSLLGVFLFYTILFCFNTFPLLTSKVFNVIPNGIPIATVYLFLIFILTLLIFLLRNKNYFINILKDIRPFRLLHFELMFISGIALTKVLTKEGSVCYFIQNNIINFIFILISISLAWLFSVTTNNIEDVKIDKISNKARVSALSAIPLNYYRLIALLSLFFSLIFSLAVNFWVFVFILCFTGNYFLYSIPPLRLKKVPIFSKLIISFNSLLLLLLGYLFAGGNLSKFPPFLTLFFLSFFPLAINFIDIKDYEGDKKTGIKTLPVIFGLRESKLLIGLFFLIPAVVIPLLFHQPLWLMPALVFATLEFILINRKNYQEKWVFSLYLMCFIILLVYLIL